MQDLSSKLAIVTGATSGIGLEMARGLATMGATVLVHGRTDESAGKAVAEIASTCGHDRLHPIAADLSTLDTVRSFAESIMSQASQIDILCNNAGVFRTERTLSADGYELHFAVNHLAPFLLTNLLLEGLKASAPARIITTASAAHKGAKLDLDDVMFSRRSFRPYAAYGQSKLANILFTRALARRIEGSGVTATCFHPGVVATEIARGRGLTAKVFNLARPFFKTPRKGAKTGVFLASDPSVDGANGDYFVDCLKTQPEISANSESLENALWDLSLDLVEA
ncbi:MAG: SDR family oxidoreductase [Pseudomonadota bacterium]